MKYDVIVCGGGTAGCAFAYTAGKLGLKTLLIEKNNFLGGTMTSGLVTPAMKTSDKNINTDFYKELMNNLSLNMKSIIKCIKIPLCTGKPTKKSINL